MDADVQVVVHHIFGGEGHVQLRNLRMVKPFAHALVRADVRRYVVLERCEEVVVLADSTLSFARLHVFRQYQVQDDGNQKYYSHAVFREHIADDLRKDGENLRHLCEAQTDT